MVESQSGSQGLGRPALLWPADDKEMGRVLREERMHPGTWVSLGQSEVQHVACEPDWPGQSPSALGQLLLVRWVIPAEATGVKAAVQPTPQ